VRHSSLCTTLGAAESFSPSHLSKPEIASLIDRAQNFYLGGFFLTHGLESALILAKHAAEKNKVSLASVFPRHGRSEVSPVRFGERELPRIARPEAR
jgi:hypothetical protein